MLRPNPRPTINGRQPRRQQGAWCVELAKFKTDNLSSCTPSATLVPNASDQPVVEDTEINDLATLTGTVPHPAAAEDDPSSEVLDNDGKPRDGDVTARVTMTGPAKARPWRLPKRCIKMKYKKFGRSSDHTADDHVVGQMLFSPCKVHIKKIEPEAKAVIKSMHTVNPPAVSGNAQGLSRSRCSTESKHGGGDGLNRSNYGKGGANNSGGQENSGITEMQKWPRINPAMLDTDDQHVVRMEKYVRKVPSAKLLQRLTNAGYLNYRYGNYARLNLSNNQGALSGGSSVSAKLNGVLTVSKIIA